MGQALCWCARKQAWCSAVLLRRAHCMECARGCCSAGGAAAGITLCACHHHQHFVHMTSSSHFVRMHLPKGTAEHHLQQATAAPARTQDSTYVYDSQVGASHGLCVQKAAVLTLHAPNTPRMSVHSMSVRLTGGRESGGVHASGNSAAPECTLDPTHMHTTH